MVVGSAGNRDSSGFGQSLQPISDVHPIAVDVFTLHDDVTEIDANAEIKPPFWRQESVPFRLLLLDFDRTAHGVDHAVELDQNPITHGLDQPTMVRCDPWLENFLQIGLKARARPLFVDLAQTAIANDIGDQDGCEVTLHARSFADYFFHSLPQVVGRCHCCVSWWA